MSYTHTDVALGFYILFNSKWTLSMVLITEVFPYTILSLSSILHLITLPILKSQIRTHHILRLTPISVLIRTFRSMRKTKFFMCSTISSNHILTGEVLCFPQIHFLICKCIPKILLEKWGAIEKHLGPILIIH